MWRVIGLLSLILLVFQYSLWQGARPFKIVQLQQDIELQQQKNRQLQQRNQALGAEVISLKQDLEAIEARARNELGFIKPGETFFQIIESAE